MKVNRRAELLQLVEEMMRKSVLSLPELTSYYTIQKGIESTADDDDDDHCLLACCKYNSLSRCQTRAEMKRSRAAEANDQLYYMYNGMNYVGRVVEEEEEDRLQTADARVSNLIRLRFHRILVSPHPPIAASACYY